MIEITLEDIVKYAAKKNYFKVLRYVISRKQLSCASLFAVACAVAARILNKNEWQHWPLAALTLSTLVSVPAASAEDTVTQRREASVSNAEIKRLKLALQTVTGIKLMHILWLLSTKPEHVRGAVDRLFSSAREKQMNLPPQLHRKLTTLEWELRTILLPAADDISIRSVLLERRLCCLLEPSYVRKLKRQALRMLQEHSKKLCAHHVRKLEQIVADRKARHDRLLVTSGSLTQRVTSLLGTQGLITEELLLRALCDERHAVESYFSAQQLLP